MANNKHEFSPELCMTLHEALEHRLGDMEKQIYGNGKPGLLVQINVLTERIENLMRSFKIMATIMIIVFSAIQVGLKMWEMHTDKTHIIQTLKTP